MFGEKKFLESSSPRIKDALGEVGARGCIGAAVLRTTVNMQRFFVMGAEVKKHVDIRYFAENCTVQLEPRLTSPAVRYIFLARYRDHMTTIFS